MQKMFRILNTFLYLWFMLIRIKCLPLNKSEEKPCGGETFCSSASRCHSLPDSRCNFQKFCADPVTNLTASVVFMNNAKLEELEIRLPDTNTELYSLISKYVCKLSVFGMSDDTIFHDILKMLNTSFKIGNKFQGRCYPETKNHYLPSFSCAMAKHCLPPIKVPHIPFYLFDDISSSKEKLKKDHFDMKSSDNRFYHKLAIIMCSLHQKGKNEESGFFNNTSILSIENIDASNRNNSKYNSHRNLQKYSEHFGYYGTVAGFTIPIVIVLVFLLGISLRYRAMKKKRNTGIYLQETSTSETMYTCSSRPARINGVESSIRNSSDQSVDYPATEFLMLHDNEKSELPTGDNSDNECKDENAGEKTRLMNHEKIPKESFSLKTMPFDQFRAERNTGDNDTVHVHDMKGNDSFTALKKRPPSFKYLPPHHEANDNEENEVC